MQKLLVIVGMTVGGWVGWALGAAQSFFVAFLLSIVGTAAGVYVGRKVAKSLGG